VCLGCGRCWQWEGTSWRSADLPEGYPSTGGAPTLADLPTQPDQPDADFVVTEVWIDQWASDAPPAYPTVDDLETGEAISVADCPPASDTRSRLSSLRSPRTRHPDRLTPTSLPRLSVTNAVA